MDLFNFGEAGKQIRNDGVVGNYLQARSEEEFISCVAYWELEAAHNFMGTHFQESK
jgi:hypothetical protein